MAVERRLYWLRHLILIVIVAIVLFPMVWLASTSVRRDQAAFSSNLFSNRVTLQHYRNLLFPERSVGRLILDLQSAAYSTGDYRGKSQTEIENTVEKYLAKFESLMTESDSMIATVETKMEEVRLSLMQKESVVIEQLQELQAKDAELFKTRLASLDKEGFSNDQIAAASGEILKSIKPSLEGLYPFYVKLLGDHGIAIGESLSNYRRLYDSVISLRDDTLSLVRTFEFEQRNEVVSSLESINSFISLSSNDYSEWRRTEWLRIINRYLRDLESQLPEEEADRLLTTRTNLYDTFREAGSAWEDLMKASDSTVGKLEELSGEIFGEGYRIFNESSSELSETIKLIGETEKRISSLNSAVLELEDSLSIALPTVVSETRKLSALVTPLARIVSAGAVRSDPINQARLVASLNEMELSLDKISLIYSVLSSSNDSLSLVASIDELLETMNWFKVNRNGLVDNSSNPELVRGVDVINVSLSNLSRVVPVLEVSADDYSSVLLTLADSSDRLRSLKVRRGQLEELVEKHEDAAQKADLQYRNAVKSVYLQGAISMTESKVGSLEAGRNYVSRVSSVINTYFDERAANRYRSLFWFDDFNRAYSEAKEGTAFLKDLVKQMRVQKDELADKIESYIELRFLGTSITLDDFRVMQETYNGLFQQVNAKYQRASRLISDLLDKPASYSSTYSAKLREVDRALFRANQIWAQKESTYFYFVRWLGNSVIVALSVALISVIVAALAAYPFSRMRFPGRRQGLLVLLLIQMFPSIMFMVAIYALLQFLGSIIPFIGLNSLGGLIFAYSGGIAFNIWLIKGYYDTISNALEEAAMIDGATKFQAFSKIIIPLARPILAVIAILTFMNIFNEFLIARILLQDINRWTYAVGLWQFSGRFETSWGPFTAAALIGAVPMVVFFLVLQDYIVGGLTQGSVKE